MKICSPSSPGDMKKKEQVLQDMFVIFDFQIKWRRCPLLDNVFTPLEAIFALSCLCYGRHWAPNNIINPQININPHSPKVSSMACLRANLYEFHMNCMYNASLAKLHKQKTQALIFFLYILIMTKHQCHGTSSFWSEEKKLKSQRGLKNLSPPNSKGKLHINRFEGELFCCWTFHNMLFKDSISLF